MNKKIKVIELLNLLAENKIEKATKIKYGETIYIVDFPNLCGIYPEGGTTRAEDSLFAKLDICALDYDVEILEDEEEIDIQGIEEKDISYVICDSDFEDGCITKLLNRFFKENQKYIDEILKAVKQLDKKINKEE